MNAKLVTAGRVIGKYESVYVDEAKEVNDWCDFLTVRHRGTMHGFPCLLVDIEYYRHLLRPSDPTRPPPGDRDILNRVRKVIAAILLSSPDNGGFGLQVSDEQLSRFVELFPYSANERQDIPATGIMFRFESPDDLRNFRETFCETFRTVQSKKNQSDFRNFIDSASANDFAFIRMVHKADANRFELTHAFLPFLAAEAKTKAKGEDFRGIPRPIDSILKANRQATREWIEKQFPDLMVRYKLRNERELNEIRQECDDGRLPLEQYCTKLETLQKKMDIADKEKKVREQKKKVRNVVLVVLGIIVAVTLVCLVAT